LVQRTTGVVVLKNFLCQLKNFEFNRFSLKTLAENHPSILIQPLNQKKNQTIEGKSMTLSDFWEYTQNPKTNKVFSPSYLFLIFFF